MATVGFVASQTLLKPQKQNISSSKLPIYKSHSLNQKTPNLQKLLRTSIDFVFFAVILREPFFEVTIFFEVKYEDNRY